jgi:hypothetical protein
VSTNNTNKGRTTTSKNGDRRRRLRLARAAAAHVRAGCDYREAGRRVGLEPRTTRLFLAYNLPPAEWADVAALRSSRPRPGFPRKSS